MKPGGDPRRRLRTAAAALVALSLLPVAFLASPAHRPTAAPLVSPGAPGALRAQNLDLPAVEASQRGRASNLFAPFAWDGSVAAGAFVQFDYLPATGTILDYIAINSSQTSVLVDSITIAGFTPSATPLLSGATFAATSNNVIVVSHDEPMALLEIRTLGHPQNITFRFPDGTAELQVSRATTWPASTLAFSNGKDAGRMIVGHGILSVVGTSVTASLSSYDYLALRAVPGFLEHAAQRTAILDAFASGRLAAEFDLVAVLDGGWIENSAQYHALPGAVDSSVRFNLATLSLSLSTRRGGLILLAFDPQTMPMDAQHRLVVQANGAALPEASDPLASLFALPGSSDQAAYVRLSMNATVIAAYLPNLTAVTLQVQSLAIPPPGIDRPTQFAIIAAVFVVAVAAAIMFQRRPR